MRRLAPFVLALCAGGCAFMPDHTLDYRQARDGALLQLPEGAQTRPIRPLYDIPAAVPADRQVVLTSGKKGKEKFVAPAPAPLALPAASPVTVTAAAAPVPPGKPRLGSDGNGALLLHVDGDADQVWDSLARALQNGKFTVEDKNRTLGLFFVDWSAPKKKTPLQLKVTRMSGASIVSLQKDDDTVADTALTNEFFDRLIRYWPG